jgi:predicted Rossmann fold flavoprotein
MIKIRKIAVIGGGASGMVASIVALRAGNHVEVFEKSAKLGRKILATGNGRCNITNESISVENYHGKHPSFVREALKNFSTNEAKKFFSLLGLELTEGANGRLYPMSLQSSSVVEFLAFEMNKLGVLVHLESEVQKIEKFSDKFLVDGREFDAVVIATGSQAMPTLGSSDSGYKFARSFGHKIEKPFASLVQLVCDDTLVHGSSGVKIEANIEVFVDKKSKMSLFGDLLFTNYGLSGSAVLDVSRTVSSALSKGSEVVLMIDLLPKLSQEALKSLLLKRAKLSLPNELWLNGIIHKKLINLIFDRAKLSLSSDKNSKNINKLSYAIKNLAVTIEASRGVKSCEVMAGGVSTKDINPKTMESTLLKGLYFCGEVLDIDGDCGGYNLHFAWASGMLVGKSLS